MKHSTAISAFLGVLMLGTLSHVPALGSGAQGGGGFSDTAGTMVQRAKESVEELARLREQLAAEKLPMARELSRLEAELSSRRAEFQSTARLLDGRNLDLTNLRGEIKSRVDEQAYLSNLLREYTRNFESRLHISELQRHRDVVEAAKLAPDNSNLSQAEVFATQVALVSAALDRIADLGAGTRFDGKALDPQGLVRDGTFLLVGHAGLFRSKDGSVVGTVEQRLGSMEPSVRPFADPAMAELAAQLVLAGAGRMPFDPSQGNAQKIEETKETLVEHIQKGGPVMVPILAMAAAALVVALFKWLSLTLVGRPSRKSVSQLLESVRKGDHQGAKSAAAGLKGPAGEMLRTGVEHMREPRELIEEVMYEHVVTTKLRVQRFLPFVAICAASAPLLGLLGTVTGIINTFKLLTVFGSGDVKSLSGGISEALITTEFGLIVAIPSLLLHSFLSRKASSIVSQMESSAVRFANEVSLASGRNAAAQDLAAEDAPARRESAGTPLVTAH